MLAVFIFYGVANGIQSRLAFSRDLQHCNVITFDGHHWINTDFDSFGIHNRVVTVNSKSLIRHLKRLPIVTGIIFVEIKSKKHVPWKPFWVRSCNEICRYLTNVDIGFTFNPRHLWSKLIKYNNRNYELILCWRREHGFIRGR